MDRVLNLVALVAILAYSCSAEDFDCELSGATSDTNIDQDLIKLAHNVGSVTYKDTANKDDYTISLCQKVASDPAVTSKNGDKSTTLGVTNQVQTALYGNEWALISFGGGDNYTDGNCAGKHRRSYIHITCNAQTDKALVKSAKSFIKTGTCYYLFEIDTKHICNEQNPNDKDGQDNKSEDNKKGTDSQDNGNNSQKIAKSGGSSGMSFFSILLIVVLLGVFFYFSIGILYKRIYLDARGWEQLPNSEVWFGLGDKCVGLLDRLRYGGASRPDRYYNNIETGAQAFSQETDDANDDNLLSM